MHITKAMYIRPRSKTETPDRICSLRWVGRSIGGTTRHDQKPLAMSSLILLNVTEICRPAQTNSHPFLSFGSSPSFLRFLSSIHPSLMPEEKSTGSLPILSMVKSPTLSSHADPYTACSPSSSLQSNKLEKNKNKNDGKRRMTDKRTRQGIRFSSTCCRHLRSYRRR